MNQDAALRTDSPSAPRGGESPWPRRIGSRGSAIPGPVVIAVCGIHGNEPAGVFAARRVLDDLAARQVTLRGEFLAIAGNLRALEANTRYVEKDLNRQWTPERSRAILGAADPSALAGEDREQWEVWRELGPAFARAREEDGGCILFDLHTSSADGAPFVTMGDTLRNRTIVFRLPVPVMLGLEEVIDGALLEYVNNLGHITVGVEGGRHDQPSSVDNHEAVLWLGLLAAGCVQPADVPRADEFRDRLARAAAGIPHIVEVRYRHAIGPDDCFRMKPGFVNFDAVKAGDELGRDRDGVVRSSLEGMLLLPLYQGLGDDGFFLGREVRPFWLGVSALMRRLRLPRLATLLPGVRLHPDELDTLIVDTRVARLYPLDLFHLLGYRKRRWVGKELVVTRRHESFGIGA